MENIKTDLGKIYCKYNEATDDFDKLRVVSIKKDEDGKNIYILRPLNEKYRLHPMPYENSFDKKMTDEEYTEVKKNWILLKSEGIISVTNVVSVENEVRQIKDVICIFFPNNKATKVPDINQPYVVARQGIDNIFAELAGYTDEVGVSVSIDTLPIGYALSDFMENSRTLSSTLCHVYKTDVAFDLANILHNDETIDILHDLYDHRVLYLKNTNPSFVEDKNLRPVNGYCNTLVEFITESGFMDDVYHTMGITKIDTELIANEELSIDDKLLIAALFGGIKINKAVPLAFDYDVNMEAIKMKYVMVIDAKDNLWIVPYTESPKEIDPEELYNLTEDRTKLLQERLSKVVKAYDRSVNIKSDFAMNMLDNNLLN